MIIWGYKFKHNVWQIKALHKKTPFLSGVFLWDIIY